MLSDKLRNHILVSLSETEVKAASHLERLARVPHPSNRQLRRHLRQERKHSRMLRLLAGLPAYRPSGSDGQVLGDRDLGGWSASRFVRLTYGAKPSTLPRVVQLAWLAVWEHISLASYTLLLLLPIWSRTDRQVLKSIQADELGHISYLVALSHWHDRAKAYLRLVVGLLMFIFTPIDDNRYK